MVGQLSGWVGFVSCLAPSYSVSATWQLEVPGSPRKSDDRDVKMSVPDACMATGDQDAVIRLIDAMIVKDKVEGAIKPFARTG